jgi:hypothetical protein
MDEEGNQVHVKDPSTEDITTATEIVARSSTDVQKRSPKPIKSYIPSPLRIFARAGSSWSYYCGCGLSLNNGDCDAAVADLKGQFDHAKTGIDPGLSYYSICGSVMVFGCNYRTSASSMYISYLYRPAEGYY